MEKIPYTRSLKVVCDNAANFFILDDPVPSGARLFVQHISIEDRTTLAAAVRFGRGKDENEPHWWEEQLTIVVNTVRWMTKEQHMVPDGQRVLLRLDGATVGDRIWVEIEGYMAPKVLSDGPFTRVSRGEG